MSNEIKTVNPADEKPITTYDLMDENQAFEAIEACHDAFDKWRLKSPEERAEVIRAVGKALRDNKEEFAQLMTQEVGKLIGDSRDEIDLCAAICDFTADNGPKELADEERDIPGGTGVVTYSPVGVIYGIQPWNFPCYQAVRYSIANLMAGNGVLLKHAENCTGSGLFLQKVMERGGLPQNLFTVLVIDHDTSDKVIGHKLVRGVTMTGSDKALFECCVDLDRLALNTEGNAIETANWAHKHAFSSLLLVTSAYHLPRAEVELQGALPDVRLIPYPVQPSGMDLKSWYRQPATIRLLLREYVKYTLASFRILGQNALRSLRS